MAVPLREGWVDVVTLHLVRLVPEGECAQARERLVQAVEASASQ